MAIKTLFQAIFYDPCSLIVNSVLDCRLSNVCYRMIKQYTSLAQQQYSCAHTLLHRYGPWKLVD